MQVLQVELEAPTRSLGGAEPLMHRVVKYLALGSSMKSEDGKASTSGSVYSHPVILKLLIIWLFECPRAVQCFLDSHLHLTYLLELISDQTATVCVRGLAAVLLGECIAYKKTIDNGKNAFSIVDAISQKIGLTSYFSKFNDMQNSLLFTSAKPALTRKPLSRSNAASMSDIENVEEEEDSTDPNSDDYSMLAMVFDSQFVDFVKRLDAKIREQIVEIYSHPKTQVAVVPAELEKKSGESDEEYIQRLKRFVEKQCLEIQDLLSRNTTLAEDLSRIGGTDPSQLEHKASAGSERVQVETLRRDLHETSQRLEALIAEKSRIEAEASMHRSAASKMESDLKSLSGAYNSLEEVNFQLEREVKALKSGGSVPAASADIEAIKAEAREEAQRESEAELNDLLVCLGQEQSKVEKLSARLSELGVDATKLLDSIGEDMGLDGDDDEEEEED